MLSGAARLMREEVSVLTRTSVALLEGDVQWMAGGPGGRYVRVLWLCGDDGEMQLAGDHLA